MFAIVLAALDRSGSVLPILCAMAVHELAHIVMMLACGGQVRRLTLRFADLQIAASGLGYRQELLSALAGPLVNLICGAAFCMQRPSFAAYSLMLGIYNLLPVWPLDGGRVLRCASVLTGCLTPMTTSATGRSGRNSASARFHAP